MCTTCGCGEGDVHIEGHVHGHEHVHADAHGHHDHGSGLGQHHTHDYGRGSAGVHVPGIRQSRMVQIEQDILAKNNAYAAANRRWFADRGILALNLVSSPGAGKTTLLTRSITDLQLDVAVAVIEGDQQSSQDADRIRATGASAIQINTGKGCHLDGHMVGHALEALEPEQQSVVFIENVGNLVCPAAFDLGEAHKVVILAVTEGEDKPLKYPDMFHAADVLVLNKIDLLPYLEFDLDRCIDYARRVNPDIAVIQLSATEGSGLETWYEWIHGARQVCVSARPALFSGP